MAQIGPFGFSKGLNTKSNPLTLGADQMCDAQNVYVYNGTLTKLGGSSKINTNALNSGAVVTGLADWQTVTGSRYLVIVAGDKIYQSANLGASPSDITGSATITAGAGNFHTFDSLNGILAICGGSTPDAPLQWTGTGNVSLLAGTPPSGNLCITANNFLFISGIAATPSRVYWSSFADPNTWPAASFVDFRKSDGDVVTAIAHLNYNLVIFKRRSTGILYTQTTSIAGVVTLGPLTEINVGTGCAGPGCWDILPDGRLVVFGSDAHLRIFDGATYVDISDQVEPQSNIQPTLDAVNPARLGSAQVTVYPAKNEVWLAVSGGTNTENDTIFIFDYLRNAWDCVVPDRSANAMTTSIDSRGTPKHPIVLLSGDYKGFVYEHDTGSTNAENADGHIDGYGTVSIQLGVESKDFIVRSIRTGYMLQTSGNMELGYGFNDLTSIQYSTTFDETQPGDLLDSTFVLDTSVLLGSGIRYTPLPIAFSGKDYSIQVQFRNRLASEPFQIFPFYLSDEVIT